MLSCGNADAPKVKTTNIDTTLIKSNAADSNKDLIQYSDDVLLFFLDSIGKLNTEHLMNKVASSTDSSFKMQQQFDKLIAKADFDTLKQACEDGFIKMVVAKRIFGDFEMDSIDIQNGFIRIYSISFDKKKNTFNEFAIGLGYSAPNWSCELYFFKQNKLISKHFIFHKQGLDLKHFKDADGKTLIYYPVNFTSGTGIWWYNLYFYKYYNNKLIPVLNEIQEANFSPQWGFRGFNLKTFVLQKAPLKLKIVYEQALYTANLDSTLVIVNDSTIVEYHWNEKSKTLEANYEKSKINKAQILSYYAVDNELLFMNVYYKTLRDCLIHKNKQNLVLNYLNKAKNYIESKKGGANVD